MFIHFKKVIVERLIQNYYLFKNLFYKLIFFEMAFNNASADKELFDHSHLDIACFTLIEMRYFSSDSSSKG